MKSLSLVAVTLLLSTGAAFAGEGNNEPFPNIRTHGAVTHMTLADTGAAAYPMPRGEAVQQFAPGQARIVPGASMTLLQTQNSAPRGF